MRPVNVLGVLSLWLLLIVPTLGWTQDDSTVKKRYRWLLTDPEVFFSAADDFTFSNRVWAFLEFTDVPTESQKAVLQLADVRLYQYQPDLQWFASFPSNTSPQLLKEVGVSAIRWRTLSQRMDDRLEYDNVPAYALVGSDVRATVVVAATGEYSEMRAALNQEGIEVQDEFQPLGFLMVTGSVQALKAVAKLPFVLYIELPDPPAELEIEDEMTTTRGPYVNGYYNLDGLTGDGITIAVNEGGIVNTAYDPDFKNRIDRSLESGNASGHKTGVSWRMASAGNIDPTHRGQAWGATLQSGGINFTNAAAANINIVNNSFGWGCISGNSTYNTGASTNDFLVRTNSRFMITYSCGNIGGSTCNAYGAGSGWGNITGLTKSGKNIFAVGAMNTNDQLTGFSSRGPAMDGRILPDITATGPGGTSHASPNLAGVNALLTEAYRNENSGQWPNSGLIKNIILNTADDIENVGPDFKTGFGRINARRAEEVIEEGQYLTDNVSNNTVTTNSINVPVGVSQLKVSVYWNDQEAIPGITTKTLVNDLDMRVQEPGGNWVYPWVLNTFPHPDSLNALATQGVDTLNNIEMVTIDNPASGNYLVQVVGSLVPFGPQDYYVVYSFVYDELTVIYPQGGEGLVPGENRRIRWDAYDTGNTFDLEFSSDDGNSWQSIVTGLASNVRSYTWNIPNTISGECLVKVKSGGDEEESHDVFTIVAPPTNLNLVWRCADSAIFAWDTVAGAMGYRVYRLGNKYMDTASFTTNAYAKLYNLSSTEDEWVSVQAVLPDSGSGRRAIAISIPPGNFNCIGIDLSLSELSPVDGHYPSCLLSDSLLLEAKFLNSGTSNVPYVPLAYQINGGAITYDTLFTPLNSAAQAFYLQPNALALNPGTNTLQVWANYLGDANPLNDTITVSIEGYTSNAEPLPYTQDFDNFNSCSTAWGCESIVCGLSEGWYNLPNQNGIDSIDWRTDANGTGSGGTGPSGDHTSGNGNYLYLEGSGNGGSGCQNKEAQLHSPCFDLTGTNSPTISYWYHAFGGAIGSLHMDVLAGGQWHTDVATPIVGAQGNQWLQQTADLSAFVGENIIVRFRGRTGGGWQSDLAIDDINLTTLPLADFQTYADSFCLGQTIPLQNLSTYSTTYTWAFQGVPFTYASGNGTSVNPSITPTAEGWIDAQLIATGPTGSDTLTIPDFVYVGDFDDPEIFSDADDDIYCFDEPAEFEAFGDGSTFDFYYNGALVQSGADDFWDTASVNDGDVVWVEQVINPQCVLVSDQLDLTVQPDYSNIQLWTSEPDLEICEGDLVEFMLPDDFEGYEFWVDGELEQFGQDTLFETDEIFDGDEVEAWFVDDAGCEGETDPLLFTVYPLPATPDIISLGGDSLEASVVAPSYLWWFNAQLLPDTTQIIVAQGSGSYEVQALDENCESELSEIFQHIMVGVAEWQSGNIRLFPNPARETVFLELDDATYQQVQLFDGLGKLVLQQAVSAGRNSIDLSKVAAGTYTLRLDETAGAPVFLLLVQ